MRSSRRPSSIRHLLRIVVVVALLVALFPICADASNDPSHDDAEVVEEEEEEERTGTIVGIDLGTTYSCVAVYRHGKVEIVPNDQGNRITPSYVAFSGATPTDDDDDGDDGDGDDDGGNKSRLVGDAAKNRATLNPINTIFDVKRLIGRKYDDASVQADRKLMPYEIVSGDDDRPYISITTSSSSDGSTTTKTTKYAPEEISAMILSKLKYDAERYLGRPVDRAVITVPAYFNDAQRHATRDAGIIAGLRVERIINEPTAAAMAYGIASGGGGKNGGGGAEGEEEEMEEQNVLVFDLGGGTFDVTILTIEDGVFEVLSTNGDTHLGGSDFDRTVMEYFLDVIRTKSGRDLSGDKRALQKLRREAERAKRALSAQTSARLEIDDLAPRYDFSETLTRAKFEELNGGLFRRTLGPVRRAMDDAGLDVDEIDEIVLVGGSTRIPRVQRLIRDYFGGKEPNGGVNPDEAVAHGAAIQGSILSGEGGESVRDVMLLDVAPLSLGTETAGGIMTVLIPRGTTVPTERTMDFHTLEDDQRTMTIDVYEGERTMTNDNRLLGLFDMTDLPRGPRGEVDVRVTFGVDSNGMLEVTAVVLATQYTKKITIAPEDGRLSEEEISRMVKDAERYATEDRREAERIEARNELESKLYRIRNDLTDDDDAIPTERRDDDKRNLANAVDEALEWLEGHPDADATEYDDKFASIEELSAPVMRSIYEGRGADGGGAGVDDEL
uniref:Mitochondrial-type heat shock protein 70 n=1 Tax=Odontella aurita TaxID=265563 RepID=A0A7S4IIL7_9STRA